MPLAVVLKLASRGAKESCIHVNNMYLDSKQDTKGVASNVNQLVRDLITTGDDDNETSSPERDTRSEKMDCDVESVEHDLDLGSVLTVLTSQLSSEFVQTRLAVLKWVMLFLEKTPNKVGALT